jgi:serine/threonine protein kinase
VGEERGVTPSALETDSQATVESDFPLDGLFKVADSDPFAPTAIPAGPFEPTRALAGRRLGHYSLLAELGRGGMGIVYEAQDERLDRKVAIKMLKFEGQPTLQRRLVREAKAMAKLKHPNVVSVYEIGEHEGLTFIVMEYVEGVTLRAWLVEAPRSVVEIVAAFTAAGRGLAAIHAAGLVHRDFKPDNLMIREDGQVMVMDLGIARRQALSQVTPGPAFDGDVSSLELTKPGVMLGSPGYMPPEQIAGQEVTPQTDQFSFCVSLWEALYGVRPFEADNLGVLVEAVSTGRMRKVERRDVPAELHAVLERGLRVEPAQRFESMAALLEAVEGAMSRRPVPWRWLVLAMVLASMLVLAVAYALIP